MASIVHEELSEECADTILNEASDDFTSLDFATGFSNSNSNSLFSTQHIVYTAMVFLHTC